MRVTIFIMLTLAMALLSLYCYGIGDGYDALSPEDSLVEIDFRIFQRGGQSVPSIGQIRVCVIFVDRETGEYTPNAQYWPSPGNPSYQTSFF